MDLQVILQKLLKMFHNFVKHKKCQKQGLKYEVNLSNLQGRLINISQKEILVETVEKQGLSREN